MRDELTEGGAHAALYTALIGAIQAHEFPYRAARAALAAVEHEHVKLLYTPTQFGVYLDAFASMQEELKRNLHAKFGEPP